MMKFYKQAITLCIAIACILISQEMHAQNKYLKQVSDLPDVQYMYISGNTVSLNEIPGLDMGEDNTISSVEIINCDDISQYDNVVDKISPLLNGLPLISRAKKQNVMVDLYGERQDRRIKQLLLIVKNDNSVQFIYITGDMDAEKLKSIHDSDVPK